MCLDYFLLLLDLVLISNLKAVVVICVYVCVCVYTLAPSPLLVCY